MDNSVDNITLGDVSVIRIEEMHGPIGMTPDQFFPGSPEADWQAERDMLTPHHLDPADNIVQVVRLRAMLLGDAAFGAGSRHFADAHARTGQRTYCYEFGWRSPALDGQLGATHVVETPLALDNLLPELRGEDRLLGPGEPPQQLADQMHRSWIGFVTDGTPGWPQYLVESRTTMRIDEDWTPIDDPHRADRAAWV